jgi:hypothetical protein
VSAPFDRAAGDGPAGLPACMPGLLEKLLAAVRPEFRADEPVFDARHPVLGGKPCLVPECDRRAQARGEVAAGRDA